MSALVLGGVLSLMFVLIMRDFKQSGRCRTCSERVVWKKGRWVHQIDGRAYRTDRYSPYVVTAHGAHKAPDFAS